MPPMVNLLDGPLGAAFLGAAFLGAAFLDAAFLGGRPTLLPYVPFPCGMIVYFKTS